MKKALVLLSSFLFLCGCATMTKPRGYIFPDNLDAQIESIKTVDQLTDAFGHPTARTVHGPMVWIYYGARENHHGPFPQSWDDRTVMLAHIDGKKVSKIQIIRDVDLPRVKPAVGETEIPAAIELNVFQELINNVGRFTPAGLGS
jgi:hypothetical protein